MWWFLRKVRLLLKSIQFFNWQSKISDTKLCRYMVERTSIFQITQRRSSFDVLSLTLKYALFKFQKFNFNVPRAHRKKLFPKNISRSMDLKKLLRHVSRSSYFLSQFSCTHDWRNYRKCCIFIKYCNILSCIENESKPR